ncbi:hypothetical protein [Aquidulcibacter sp.]|jgi:hypothetical protein|uniref:hypothetical protein n=1 Tax=Aquidulcibacter sp. TaxID=2052990 RepID=UPI0037839A9A
MSGLVNSDEQRADGMLVHHVNEGTLWNLPQWSALPRKDQSTPDFEQVYSAGFSGLQVYAPNADASKANLSLSGMARILDGTTCDATIAQHKAWGFQATTLHLGTGFETLDAGKTLVQAVLDASARHSQPVFIETHRATITQDPARTLDLIAAFPEMRFNADLSHWYTGQEMRYGDFEAKLDKLQPFFERVRFMHLRMGHSCEMQTPLFLLRENQAWEDYCLLWSLCMRGFLNTAEQDERFFAVPELLPASVSYQGRLHTINYARLNDPSNPSSELSDRWLEALELKTLIESLWLEATNKVLGPTL